MYTVFSFSVKVSKLRENILCFSFLNIWKRFVKSLQQISEIHILYVCENSNNIKDLIVYQYYENVWLLPLFNEQWKESLNIDGRPLSKAPISTEQTATYHLKSSNTNKITTYGIVNPDPGLGQAHKCGGGKSVDGFCIYLNWNYLA